MPNQRPGQQPGAEGLCGEIEALRGLIQRLMAMADEDQGLAEMLKIVEITSRASGRLATLIAAQQRMDAARASQAGLSEELDERIEEIARRYPARPLEEVYP